MTLKMQAPSASEKGMRNSITVRPKKDAENRRRYLLQLAASKNIQTKTTQDISIITALGGLKM